MAQGREDRFANVAATKLTMSGSNALSFAEMLTGISLGQGVGMLIDQIDYIPSNPSLRELVTVSDTLSLAVSTSNDVTNIEDMSDRRIIHGMKVVPMQVGAVVSLTHIITPFTHQFFPPMIIASPRIYLAAVTAGAASASVIDVRIFFRYISLTPQQYLELAEAFILAG